MTAGARFFGRVVTIEVDTLKVEDLRIAFKIEKSLTKDPNTLDLVIYNLSEASRKRIQTTGAAVSVQAGYEGNIELLFKGDATIINHARQGPDWLTRLQSADGSKKMRGNYVAASFGPGTSIADVMKTIATQSGHALGNLVDAVGNGNVRNTLTQFAKGFAVSGNATDELAKLSRTMGYEFSIQDGAIQLSEPGKPVGNVVVELRQDTGLIGSPELAEVAPAAGAGAPSGTKKTVIKVRSLIQQKLMPGRAIHLVSNAFNGFFRIEKVTFTGDTHAEPWYADMELAAAAIT